MSPKAEKSQAGGSEGPLDFFDELRSQVDELSKEKEQAERKAAEYLDKLKRLQADMENLQKMTKKQMDTVTKQASENLLVKLLPVLDALQQAGTVTHSSDSLSSEEISVGLKMIFNQLIDILKTEGLEQIAAMGELSNPERHEVVSFVERDDVPENTIVEEVRRGYTLGGKVIRPSLVVVSKPKKTKGLELKKTQED